MCCNTGGLCEYLCCFLWLIRHFVMDQNRLTEYFGLCVAFAMRAIGERVVRLSGPFCFRTDTLGLGFSTPLKHLQETRILTNRHRKITPHHGQAFRYDSRRLRAADVRSMEAQIQTNSCTFTDQSIADLKTNPLFTTPPAGPRRKAISCEASPRVC